MTRSTRRNVTHRPDETERDRGALPPSSATSKPGPGRQDLVRICRAPTAGHVVDGAARGVGAADVIYIPTAATEHRQPGRGDVDVVARQDRELSWRLAITILEGSAQQVETAGAQSAGSSRASTDILPITDQGSHVHGHRPCTGVLANNDIALSMDGKAEPREIMRRRRAAAFGVPFAGSRMMRRCMLKSLTTVSAIGPLVYRQIRWTSTTDGDAALDRRRRAPRSPDQAYFNDLSVVRLAA